MTSISDSLFKDNLITDPKRSQFREYLDLKEAAIGKKGKLQEKDQLERRMAVFNKVIKSSKKWSYTEVLCYIY